MTATAPPFLLAAYETHMRSWGASDDTVQARRILAARFLDGRHPREVTGTEVVEFLATPGFSGYTRRTYFCHLRSLFAWAIDAGLIDVSPMERVRRPRIPKSTPKPLTDAEVTLVLDSATGDLHSWLILSMFAGMRAHEIAKIRGEDVTERSIFVIGKGGKEAYLPTHPLVLEVAERYPVKGWWFPSTRTPVGHVEGASVTRGVSKHFSRHGIVGSVHRGRHTYATQLLRRGVNLRVVQELMRHDSISTTQLYTAVDEDERREAMFRLGPPLSVVA